MRWPDALREAAKKECKNGEFAVCGRNGLAKKKRGQVCRAVPAGFILSEYDWLSCLL
jgi:hypothetical protein